MVWKLDFKMNELAFYLLNIFSNGVVLDDKIIGKKSEVES